MKPTKQRKAASKIVWTWKLYRKDLDEWQLWAKSYGTYRGLLGAGKPSPWPCHAVRVEMREI